MVRKKKKRLITKAGHFEKMVITPLSRAIFRQSVLAPQGKEPGVLTLDEVISGLKFYSALCGETEERYKIALKQLDARYGIWRIYYDEEKEVIRIE